MKTLEAYRKKPCFVAKISERTEKRIKETVGKKIRKYIGSYGKKKHGYGAKTDF